MDYEMGVQVTTLVLGITVLFCLRVAVPQVSLLLRTTRRPDDLYLFRVKTSLLFSALVIEKLRAVLVWADFTLFEQRYLGSIRDRWELDLTVAVLVMMACGIAAYLYEKIQREEKHRS